MTKEGKWLLYIIVAVTMFCVILLAGLMFNLYRTSRIGRLASTHGEPANQRLRQQAVNLLYGVDQDIDMADARRLLREAYDNGDKLAGMHLYCQLMYVPGEGVYEEAMDIWDDCEPALRRIESQGSAEAEFLYVHAYLGSLDEYGYDVEQYVDYAIRQSSAAGYMPALSMMGTFEEFGYTGPIDLARAEHWYRQSAARGSTSGLSGLGRIYSNPDYSGYDMDRALDFLEQAADRGNPSALEYLGEIYRTGEGVEADPQLAREYLQRAVEVDDYASMLTLAGMLSEGVGGAVDKDAARDLLERAAAFGWDEEAARLLEELDSEGETTD